MTVEVVGRPPWKVRRRIVYATLIFCALTVAYIVLDGRDSRLYETIAVACFGLAGMVIMAFVFGAILDDANVMRILGRDAYRDQVPEPRDIVPPELTP